MKTLLFLALLSLQTGAVKTPNTAQGTDILISWGYPALEVLDVPREFGGTLKVNSSKVLPARVTVSRASLDRNGIVTLEGQVTYAQTCTLHFRSSLRGLVNPRVANPISDLLWMETAERCPNKTVAPSSGRRKITDASTTRIARSDRSNVAYLGAFSLKWSTLDGDSRELRLKGNTSAYIRAYQSK